MAKKFPKPFNYVMKNPAKYVGDASNILLRSSWEQKFMIWADNHPSVILISSEEVAIPYFSQVDLKTHRYFPDFLLKVKTKSGEIKTYCIEIKPNAQTKPPKPATRVTKRYITEMATYSVNTAKWTAAQAWCAKHNMIFMIMDEYELGIAKRPK